MTKRSLDKKALARWRYEQILDVLGPLSRDVRGEMIRRLAKKPALWPSGDTRLISVATIYRWIGAYEGRGLSGLEPQARKDRGQKRSRLPDEVVDKALQLLGEDEDMTLTFVMALLHAEPAFDETDKAAISRSTLGRRLKAHPQYETLKRARKRARRRNRYVAKRPHQIWHTDAKGPVEVCFVSGKKCGFHVFTMLDDASRYVLCAQVAPSADLCAAVRVFRQAAKRWGLPDRLYADRASIFDSKAFRGGLAELGSHRIRVKPRNPEANGKIEAYHRCLILWFTARLKKQAVVDLVHLQKLLDGMIESLYQDHRHRGLKAPPRVVLADQMSERLISAPRLENAFKEERTKKAHPKTGEVELSGATYIVPDDLRGLRLVFRLDPDPSILPLVVHPRTHRELGLLRAHIHPDDVKEETGPERWGEGPLQKLHDAWQGKVRPNAEPGFGLLEIFSLLEKISGRPVPRTDAEAALIQSLWRTIGPLQKKPTETAFAQLHKTMGEGRPLKTYLDALKSRVESEAERTKKNET